MYIFISQCIFFFQSTSFIEMIFTLVLFHCALPLHISTNYGIKPEYFLSLELRVSQLYENLGQKDGKGLVRLPAKGSFITCEE